MKRHYDHVVIGAGALGSATAYRLAKAGARDVLVVEQFELGHGKGGSDDHSRIIRHTYHSDRYTPLTPAMFAAWAEVEEETGLTLVTACGGLDFAVAGTAGESEVANYRHALAPGISHEMLDAAEIRTRWPQWRIEDDVIALYQQNAGILDIRRACAAHRALARSRGVEFLPGTRVVALESTNSHVTVRTDDGDVTAASVVLCTASWAPKLLDPMGIDWNFTISQEQVSYFATPNVREFMPDRFPIWAWHDQRFLYGFPIYGEVAVKVSRDVSGRWVTADTRSFEPVEKETRLYEQFLRDRVPGALGPELYSKTCIYDMPPDRDFILDKLPGHPRITVAFGAAHAAKFASLIGEIAAEIAIEGRSKHPIAAFSADRSALTDPNFKPTFRLEA